MKKLIIALSILSAFFANIANASDQDILNTLAKLGYEEKTLEIQSTPIANFKSVITPDGVFYVTDDGKFLTQGPIYNMQGAQPENIANSNNIKLVKKIAKDAIVYKAKNEQHIIYVFTDYTCHYCKLLHENINSYLNAGISVYYFAFPRQGLQSDVAKNMQAIWSATDRKTAFENAYKGTKVVPASSMVPYVEMQFNVGRQIGITGTPAIILPNGQLLGGYVPADKLIEILNNM